MINSGDLSEYILIYRNVGTQDTTMGHPQREWSLYLALWAKVEYTGGGEDTDGQIIEETRANFLVRRDTSNPITSQDRIQYDSFWWDILSVTPYGHNEGYLLATRKADNTDV